MTICLATIAQGLRVSFQLSLHLDHPQLCPLRHQDTTHTHTSWGLFLVNNHQVVDLDSIYLSLDCQGRSCRVIIMCARKAQKSAHLRRYLNTHSRSGVGVTTFLVPLTRCACWWREPVWWRSWTGGRGGPAGSPHCCHGCSSLSETAGAAWRCSETRGKHQTERKRHTHRVRWKWVALNCRLLLNVPLALSLPSRQQQGVSNKRVVVMRKYVSCHQTGALSGAGEELYWEPCCHIVINSEYVCLFPLQHRWWPIHFKIAY